VRRDERRALSHWCFRPHRAVGRLRRWPRAPNEGGNHALREPRRAPLMKEAIR
jgi:hypothetical protein